MFRKFVNGHVNKRSERSRIGEVEEVREKERKVFCNPNKKLEKSVLQPKQKIRCAIENC